MVAGTASLPFSLRSCAVLLDGDIQPPDFVIRPFFPCGELTEIVGAHGNFKSTIALDACLAVASGRPWGGVATRQGRSVFITLEDSADTLARRVRAWMDGIYEPSVLATVEADLRQNFAFLSREHAQGLVLTRTTDGVTSVRDDVADHLCRLTAGGSLVVLETVSRIHDGEETNDSFAALVRALGRVMASGCALVIVRHMSKKAAREMNADALDSYAGRGGGALSDAARSVLVVTRQAGRNVGSVTLTAAKTTHAQAGDTVSWWPVVVPAVEAVRLEHRTAEMQAVDDAELLLAHAATVESGITRSALHKNTPAGLTRPRAAAALAWLVTHGRLISREEKRGRNGQQVTVYYTPAQIRGAA